MRELCELRRLRDEPTWLCFVDVSKAYDVVFREGLFVKLFDLIGKPRLWSVLVNWYTGDRSRVVAADRLSWSRTRRA